MYRWKTDVQVYFPEVDEVKKNGKKKRIRVMVRKLLLTGKAGLEPDRYSITAVRGGKSFTINGYVEPKAPLFQSLNLDFRQRPQAEWKKILTGLTQDQLLKWLAFRVIDAAEAIDHLLHDEPEEKDAA